MEARDRDWVSGSGGLNVVAGGTNCALTAGTKGEFTVGADTGAGGWYARGAVGVMG